MSRTQIASDHVIKMLTHHNPHRLGTRDYWKFGRYEDGITVAEFVKRLVEHEGLTCKNARDRVTYDVRCGRVKLIPPTNPGAGSGR